MKRTKRMICALAVLALALSMAVTGHAVETVVVVEPKDWSEVGDELTLSCRDIGELFQHWERTAYPDYVCGVWSTDGGGRNLTVGVTEDEAGEAGKAEILSLIEQDETVTFVPQKHPRNYLLRLTKQYSTEENRNRGMRGYCLYERENVLEILVDQTRQDDPQTQLMLESIQEEAGDAVRIHFVEEDFQLYAQSGAAAGKDYLYLDLMIPEDELVYAAGNGEAMGWLLLAAVLAAAAVLIVLRKRIPLLALAGGGTVSGGRLGRREVVKLLRKEAPEPSEGLDERVFAEIERK